MDFEMALETFGQLIKTAIETRLPQLLRFTDGTFPEPLQSKAISRAYGDLCHEAIIIPVPHGHRQVTAAFLVLGINSRKSYDEDYQKFISMLRHQLATSLNSIIMVEDEARHVKLSAELAARDRMQLTEKLNLSEQDARDKEMRFRSMADQAPIPMFECTTEGELLYVNESWHVLTGHPRDNFDALSWVDICHPDDRVLFSTNWARLTSGESVNFEMRLSKPYVSVFMRKAIL
jgi:PAS domain-containing protein